MIQTAQYIIAIVLSLFVFVNFGIIAFLVFGVLNYLLSTIILFIGILLAFLIFKFIRNVIIKSVYEL